MNRLKKHKWSLKLLVLAILPIVICLVSGYKTISIFRDIKYDSKLIEEIQKQGNGNTQGKISDINFSIKKQDLIELLFNMTSEYGCTVKSFVPKTLNGEYGIKLRESEIVLDGEYMCMLQLLDSVEKFMIRSIRNGNYIKVCSVRYATVKERISNAFQYKLQMTLVIQELV